MSLATAPNAFAYCTDNVTTGVPPGTTFTAGANGADGAAVTCLTALTHDVHLLRLRIQVPGVSTQDQNAAGDLLIDPAGGTSWTALINDLVCGFQSGNFDFAYYEFPIWIPAGASVGFRAKTQHTADNTGGNVVIEAVGEPSRPAMWWCGQGVETVGISDSKGTSVTPGNSGAFGSWTSVGSTTTRRWGSAHLGINGSDATALALQYIFELGVGSQKLPGSGTTMLQMQATERKFQLGPTPTFCDLAAGAQMQVRGKCSGTAENYFAAVYGVY